MVIANELRKIVDAHYEWLLVRETGRSFALTFKEIDFQGNEDGASFRFLDDDGSHTRQVTS